ncbi:LacI family DNA-binding transcriptional regulator [Actinoplanes sp. NPDC051851]|uniref:LacI family DNA-binding transcriptional regulator n=1 Tax=Actinoplanes sp. NPDC051851 TaxID=3154753 RepID=UPI00341321EE
MVTLHDVAREAGVSYATASRALNGSARTVRAENLDRVREAAIRLGYLPHVSAQAIARGSSDTVALIVGALDDPYFASINDGLAEAADQAGLTVTAAVTDRSPDLETAIVRTIRGQRPRAIVIAGGRIGEADTHPGLLAELDLYRQAGGRVAMLSRGDLPFPTLAIDNRGGARRLARALIDLGYRRFAAIRPENGSGIARERMLGFIEGLREGGVDLDARCSIDAEPTRDGGYAAASVLVERGVDGVDAVFAVNDMTAIGAMTGLRAAGVRPGVDLAIAGFDDIEAASDVTPALTSVRVPLHDLGRRALELALAGEPAGQIEVPVEVVLRESTRPRSPSIHD